MSDSMSRQDHELDVLCVGNAIVDILTHVEDRFLTRHGMRKGSMSLVDEAAARTIYADMGPAIEQSGGSAANTAAGVASFGVRAGYIGKVRDDEFGEVFRHDITAIGVDYRTSNALEGPGTARCLVLVTPDGQRTMNTFLGACTTLGPEDIDREQVAGAGVTFMEGYLFDLPRGLDLFRLAAGTARQAGRKVALTLSDALCVERHRDAFLDQIAAHVDVLFANEAEAAALFRANSLTDALRQAADCVEIAVVTRSADGSLIAAGGDVLEIPAAPVAKVVDTTGAGDLYAAGFLAGLAEGAPLERCGALGSLAAAEVIGHDGARPQQVLKGLATAAE